MSLAKRILKGAATLSAVLFLCLAVVVVAEEATVPTGAERVDFQTDVRKMLDIIIHSLYTNRNIFLRELISNASDALDKIRFLYLTQPKYPVNQDGVKPEMEIRIGFDKEERTLTITDGGIGMTKQELKTNLGSIGTSGTKKFLEKMNEGTDINLIGQFGVGFYSAFLVADTVKVASKHDRDPVQHVWQSTADGTYVVYEDPRGNTLGRGTEITLYLKSDADEYLDEHKVKEIATRYSEFIQFPIKVQSTKHEGKKTPLAPKVNEDGETEDREEDVEVVFEVVNEQQPIWTRKAEEVSEEDYIKFYKAITKEDEEPFTYAHFTAEGEVEFKSILYIPTKAPFQLFDNMDKAVSSVKLYVRRVFITDDLKELLPRYLSFIRGVVDSDDLPLNVSRELLQESRILKIIKKKLVRKVLSMLKDIADEDMRKLEEQKEKAEAKAKENEKRKKAGLPAESTEEEEDDFYLPKYTKIWEEFGKSLRLGVIEDSTNRARLTKLLRYKTSKSNGEYRSLEEYVENMIPKQKDIYFFIAPGETIEQIERKPFLQRARKAGVEVLLMTDAIDEYVVSHMTEFASKRLVNLAKEDVKLPGDNEARAKRVAEKRRKAYKPFLDWCKTTLGTRVEKVVLSDRLVTSPCIVVSPKYGMTATMHRIMKGTPLGDSKDDPSQAKKIFEINVQHPVINEIRMRSQLDPNNKETQEIAVNLFETAAFQAGYSLEDPDEFVNRLQKSIAMSLHVDPKGDLIQEEDFEAQVDADEAAEREEEAAERAAEEGGADETINLDESGVEEMNIETAEQVNEEL